MKKKTIGVITIYRQNYGAFLQAYALQKTIEACGYHTELIRYDYYKDRCILSVPLAYAREPIKFLKMLGVAIIRYHSQKTRSKVFAQSIREKLRESKEYYRSYSKLKRNPPQYDIYLCGSDQVFNPRLSPQAHKSRLLCFADGIKVSYAASAGTVSFPASYNDLLLLQLSKFKSISVRERELQTYLASHLHRDVECHIDPSFLLDSDQWKAFSQPVYTEKKYVLFYRINKQPELNACAEQISKALGIPILTLDGHDRFSSQLERKDVFSPEEWVGAFVNAEYVVTNSFHGTAFSINLHKKACAILPPHNAERLKNIIDKCSLARLYDPKIISDEEVADLYHKADPYIARERARAKQYLYNIGD